MSKYDLLWEHITSRGERSCTLTFDDVAGITGFKIDHSFLNYKKELLRYGYQVGRISLKDETITFERRA